MFHIIILYIRLNIRSGFFGYLFEFFGFFSFSGSVNNTSGSDMFLLSYKIHSGIFYISEQVRIGFFGSGSDFGLWILCLGLERIMQSFKECNNQTKIGSNDV